MQAKLMTVSILSLAVAAGAAFAEQHSGDNGQMKDESAGETMQSGSGDMSAQSERSDAMHDGMDYTMGDLIGTGSLRGGDIYTTVAGYDDDARWRDADYEMVEDDWNDIGEISEVMLSEDGRVAGFVVEVGGFLDIGDKHVMLQMSEVKLVPVDENQYAIVTRLTEDELAAREEIEEGWLK